VKQERKEIISLDFLGKYKSTTGGDFIIDESAIRSFLAKLDFRIAQAIP
jgi:hypothetical protein